MANPSVCGHCEAEAESPLPICRVCGEHVCEACTHPGSELGGRVVCKNDHCDDCDDTGFFYRSKRGGSDPDGIDVPCGHGAEEEPDESGRAMRDVWDF